MAAAKTDAKSPAPKDPLAPRWGMGVAAMGFVSMGGFVPGVVVILWLQAAPAPMIPEPAAEVVTVDEGRKLIYVQLDNPISVALGTGRQMQAYLAVSLRGTQDELLSLNAAVQDKRQPIEATLLIEAQEMMAEGADGERLHAELPPRLRGVMNDQIGWPEFPEPVEEVLIISMTMQD